MMRHEVIDIRSVIFILISLFISTGMLSQIDNEDDLTTPKDKNTSEKTDHSVNKPTLEQPNINMKIDEAICPSGVECSKLGGPCLKCQFNYSCVYGEKVNVTCEPIPTLSQNCQGDKKFTRTMICRYCYQTDHWEHTCAQKANCDSVASPRVYYRTNCSVKSEILCMGRRRFFKMLPCNWTGGYRWSTALILSITLGGFGADRFYLGHWQEGIGKLFSFGGLGVWTLIDVILISLHYIGPADGSLYI